MPLFVRGKDPQGEQFIELGKTLDISGLGAFIASPRALELNGFVTLTIPAPSITSSGLVPAGMAPIQAKVMRQREAGDVYLAGVEFHEAARLAGSPVSRFPRTRKVESVSLSPSVPTGDVVAGALPQN